MNRTHTLTLVVLIVMFVVAGVWKSGGLFSNSSAGEETEKEADTTTTTLVEFWEHYNRASGHLNDGDYERAAEYYEAALQINRGHEGALYYLGNVRLLLREFEEAEKNWLELTRVNPRSARGWLQLGTLYFCGEENNSLFDLESAKARFIKAHGLNREETGPPLHLAKIALLERELDTAEKFTDIVLAQNFMSYQAIFLKGYLEWLKGNERNSKDKLSEALELYQSVHNIRMVGEGATKTGSRPMLSEDMYCDFVGERIEEYLELENEESGYQAELIYERFDSELAELK